MIRTISFSEIQTALTCQARWDFAYGDQLAGSALQKRQIAVLLSDGRAWGAAVAAWHAHRGHEGLECAYDPALARQVAHMALHESYTADVMEQALLGYRVDAGTQVEHTYRLHALLEHYMATATRMPNLTMLEGAFEVPILSRWAARVGHKRASSRYRFEGRIDGFTVLEGEGGDWIVEFKLRGTLTPRKFLALSRQHLWYAWAYQQTSGREVVGVIVDERLNEVPRPPAMRLDGTPSINKAQITTPELYIAACKEAGVEPDRLLCMHFSSRRWQQRTELLFRPGQLEEAGIELVSAAQMIRDLDRGRYPVRNGQTYICRGCRFNEICANPRDDLYVDTLFERVPPKREREKVTA